MHCIFITASSHIAVSIFYQRILNNTKRENTKKKKDAPVDAVYVSDSSVEFYLSWHYWNKVDCQRLGRVLLSFASIGIE